MPLLLHRPLPPSQLAPLLTSHIPLLELHSLHSPQVSQHWLLATHLLPPQLLPCDAQVPLLQTLQAGQPACPFVQHTEVATHVEPQVLYPARQAVFEQVPFEHAKLPVQSVSEQQRDAAMQPAPHGLVPAPQL